MKVNPLWPSSSKSPLVLDGDTIKLRLLAERANSQNMVHVDWVRFTVKLKNAPAPDVELLFPAPVRPIVPASGSKFDDRKYPIDVAVEFEKSSKHVCDLRALVARSFADLSETDYFAAAQAHKLASDVSAALGGQYVVDLEPKKGIDFYKYRWSIILNGAECGWVGYLSSSDSPRQDKQAQTIHVNVMGSACTFADDGWRDRLADLIDECAGDVTRADLALDFFEGYAGGIDAVRSAYRDGLCNVGGRKLKFNLVGDWENGHDRSVYIGSREAGKITNVYEKGDQLYGHKLDSEWLRFELRYGNKLRVLSSDLLRRPDDFFAGASDWHSFVLLEAKATFVAQPVLCKKRLEVESVTAECARAFSWAVNTAGGTFAMLLKHLDTDKFYNSFALAKLPGRLRKFSESQISQCFGNAVEKVSTAGSSPGFCVAA